MNYLSIYLDFLCFLSSDAYSFSADVNGVVVFPVLCPGISNKQKLYIFKEYNLMF